MQFRPIDAGSHNYSEDNFEAILISGYKRIHEKRECCITVIGPHSAGSKKGGVGF